MEDVRKIPISAEQLLVEKAFAPGDTVRVSVEVSTREHQVDLPAIHEAISIETVDIGQEVAEAPPIRTEGNVTIIPVLEEITVVTKRLILKQEIRLTKTQTETVTAQTVPLRTEHAVVERISPPLND